MGYLIFTGVEWLMIIFGLLAWSSLAYIIFNKRKMVNKEIPLFVQIFIYMFSLVPLGLIVGLYMASIKKEVDGVKYHKFSKNCRLNAHIIIAISVISTILSIMNL